jgi:hypothetical protein
MDLKELGKIAVNEINTAQNQNDLKQIVQKYLGKTGEITQILHSL